MIHFIIFFCLFFFFWRHTSTSLLDYFLFPKLSVSFLTSCTFCLRTLCVCTAYSSLPTCILFKCCQAYSLQGFLGCWFNRFKVSFVPKILTAILWTSSTYFSSFSCCLPANISPHSPCSRTWCWRLAVKAPSPWRSLRRTEWVQCGASPLQPPCTCARKTGSHFSAGGRKQKQLVQQVEAVEKHTAKLQRRNSKLHVKRQTDP